MQKAWKVASNDEHLVRALDVLRCPHGKAKGIHEHVGGSVTKRTELYTDQLVNTIHNAWAKSCEVINSTNLYSTANDGNAMGPVPKAIQRLESGKSSLSLVAGQVLSTSDSLTQPCKPCLGAFNTPIFESTGDVNNGCKPSHRDKFKEKLYFAAGARRVFGPELKNTPAARQAMFEEFKRLSDKGSFNWKQ